MDREKVIKGLEVCRDQDNPPGYRFTGCKDDCPYYGNGCAKKLKEDAMDQLKEQPEIVRCKDCEYSNQVCKKLVMDRKFYFCTKHKFYKIDNWYCADGEQKK